ncbi:MAG: hypothetical protein ABRQ39_17455 [Candidatus Eremiobacterota bacterium]
MSYRLVIFSIIIFILAIFSVKVLSADTVVIHAISLEVKLIPQEKEGFMDLLSLIERRMSEIGTITELKIDKDIVNFVVSTNLTSERLKYILSKKGILSVKDQHGLKTVLNVECAYFNTKTELSPELKISLSRDSSETFAKITEENIKKKLASYLDNELLSEPVVMEKITGGELMITFGYGEPQFHPDDIAVILRNGPLPGEVSIIKCEK